MMLHVTRVVLVLVGVAAICAPGEALRNERALRPHYVARWEHGLSERIRDRPQHGLISLPHIIRFVRPRNNPTEYHNGKTKLKLAGPEMETIDVCYQDDNGVPCECSTVDGEFFIDCRNESLRTTNIVPIFDMRDGGKKVQVNRVNLEGNVITELWKGQIVPGHEGTLKQLILRRNSIIYIDDGAFSDMNELVTLDLSYNRLTHLPRSAFAGGEGLEWKLQNLYLDNNLLIKIDDHVFEVLTMLKKIVLDNNMGLVLTDDTFGRLHQLRELSLDGCNLEDVPPRVFEKLINLEYLSLRGNPLSVIPAPVKALRSLYALDLSATFISEFTPKALNGDYQLKQLIARDMTYLWAIEDCAFCGLPHLEEVIFFNSSHLYFIDSNAFGNEMALGIPRRNLDVIDFENCNISSLSGDMLAWGQVKTLKLGGNRFHCDSELSWMTNLEIDFSSSDTTPACASPIHLRGRPLQSLRPCELSGTCSGFLYVRRFRSQYVICGGVLLATIVLLLGWCMCSIRRRRANGFQLLSNVSEKVHLPRSREVKEDKKALVNNDYNQWATPLHSSKKDKKNKKGKTLPPAVEV